MPACVAMTISTIAVLAAGERAFHVALEQRGERLLVLPLRMLRRERLHAVEREEQLEIHRLLGPERAVVVEGGDALGRRHEVGRAFRGHLRDEVDDGLAWPAPSFHEGSGSVWAWARAPRASRAASARRRANAEMEGAGFMAVFSSERDLPGNLRASVIAEEGWQRAALSGRPLRYLLGLTKFSSGAGCGDPRAVMPAPSAATAGSAFLPISLPPRAAPSRPSHRTGIEPSPDQANTLAGSSRTVLQVRATSWTPCPHRDCPSGCRW